MSAGFLQRIMMRTRHQLAGVAMAAQGWGDPQAPDQHPSAPDVAQQAAKDFAGSPFDEKSDRIIVREAGHRDVMLIDAAHDRLNPCLGRKRLRDDVYLAHVRSSYQAAGCIANRAVAYLMMGMADA